MNRQKMHTDYLGLKIPPTVKKRLIEVAEKRYLSLSQLVRLMIEGKLKKEINMADSYSEKSQRQEDLEKNGGSIFVDR